MTLADFHHAPYVTLDTEFMRDKTYYPKLCLVQLAAPGDENAVILDPLEPGWDPAPLWDLLFDPAVLKVVHAGRQDLEIIHQLTSRLPAPLYDTQVAAMVCGFGDQVGYEKLVRELCGAKLDKSAQFTDWAQRPLSARQLDYAAGDVLHLREVYEALDSRIRTQGREEWIAEEMAALTDPAIYRVNPRESWKRLKIRNPNPLVLAVARELAAWREEEAQRRNLPRPRILSDDMLVSLAVQQPRTLKSLARTRPQGQKAAEQHGETLLELIAKGLETPEEDCPRPAAKPQGLDEAETAVDLLKMALKQACRDQGIASRLVASPTDLQHFVLGARDLPFLHGWRRQVFGAQAEDILAGRLSLGLDEDKNLVFINQ